MAVLFVVTLVIRISTYGLVAYSNEWAFCLYVAWQPLLVLWNCWPDVCSLCILTYKLIILPPGGTQSIVISMLVRWSIHVS